MPYLHAPSATQVITRSGVTLTLALTGELPSSQNFDPAFETYYHEHLEGQPELTSVVEFQPENDGHGNYGPSGLDRKLWGRVLKDPDTVPMKSSMVNLHTIDPSTGLSVQIFRPDAAHSSSADATPVYLYAHGGGRVVGNKESGAPLLSRITSSLGFPAVSIGYSLCPEKPSSAAHEDARKAYDWVRTSLPGLLGRPVSGVINGGLSSGGQVALALTNNILCDSDEDVRKSLMGTAVALPVCDVRDSHYDSAEWAALSNPLMHAEGMKWLNHVAFPTAEERDDPRNSLVLTPSDVLAKYKNGPPITIATAEYDGLSIAGKEYADMLRKAGADVTEMVYKGLPHLAQGLDNVCQHSRDVNVELIKTIGRYGGKSEDELAGITSESLYPDPLWASTKVPASA